MSARVEIIYNPNTIIPPLDKVYWGESILLQTGETEFKALISNEFTGREIAGFISGIEKLVDNPLVEPKIQELALHFVGELYLLFRQTEFRNTSLQLTKGRVKHEYRHLEQSLAYFKNNCGGYVDFFKVHRLHRAYRLGDKEGVLDNGTIEFLDYSDEYLRTMMEIDAMLSEFQKDSKNDRLVNKECLLWRLSSTMTYLSKTDDLICDGFPHLKAMVVILTRRLDLADKNEFSQVNYAEIIPTLLDNMRLGLDNPQRFLDQAGLLEERAWEKLGVAFNLYMEAHNLFMNDTLEKKIVPDWFSRSSPDLKTP